MDTKFSLGLPGEQVGDATIVRLSRDSIADLDRNLKSAFEIVQRPGD